MTAYALVEQVDFAGQTCRPGHHQIVADIPYATRDEFGRALRAAIAALRQCSGQDSKVLVISTHGYSHTGTFLYADEAGHADRRLNLWEFTDAFASLPENTVVFVSACWGGYADAARAIQSGANRPYVVGPLVEIITDDADELQEQLLDLLDKRAPTLQGIYGIVQRFNENAALRQGSYGSLRWIFGVQDPAGTFMPIEAPGAQLAASVADDAAGFEVKRMLHHGEPVGDPMLCVVEDEQGKSWQATVANVIEIASVAAVAPGLRFRAHYQSAMAPDLPSNVKQETKSGLDAIHFVSLAK